MSQRTRLFRQRYAQTVVPQRYHGLRHVAVVLCGGLALVAAPWLWLDMPMSLLVGSGSIAATLVTASLVEYFAHRFVMHRPQPGLSAIHHRHARQHHRYFAQDDFFVEQIGDLHAALFPTVLLAFFAVVATLLSVLVGVLFSDAVAAIFFSTSVAYYLMYELVHLSAHLADHVLWRPRWLRRLNALHRRHHEPTLMRRANFNIVLPLGDWLFGTLQRDGKCSAPAVAPVAPLDAERLIRILEKH